MDGVDTNWDNLENKSRYEVLNDTHVVFVLMVAESSALKHI